MTPAFESFLTRLYVDQDARARFLADPRGEALAARLGNEEIAAALTIDRVGLELAAASFAHKRSRAARANPLRRVQHRVFTWLFERRTRC